MAEVKKNIITQGASGMLGGQIVFRQFGGKTIMSVKPNQPDEPTEGQKAVRNRFQMAVIYGKSVMADPAMKEKYSKGINKKLRSAFVVSVADFMNAPDILDVNLQGYTGAVGSIIIIRVTDDFMVESVQVEINNADGTLIESGNAVQQPNLVDWKYTATAANESISGDRITVKAFDLPGNKTTEVKQI